MSEWTYCATDLITGATLADTIPGLTVQSFSQQLNGGGSLTGSLSLTTSPAQNSVWLNALQLGRAVLWCLCDDVPVWNGVIWDSSDTTRTGGGPVPISGSTLDSVWSHRLITATLEYANVDIFALFLDLLQYGTTKTSSYITSTSPYQGPASPLVAQQAAVAGLMLPSGAAAISGEPWSASYLYSDLTQVAEAWSDLVSAGVEYAFVPATSSGNLITLVQLAWNPGTVGRAYPQSGYSLTYPGNAIDYGWTITRSQGANYLWGTAPPNGSAGQWESQYPYGVDLTDLGGGAPLMETSVSWDGSTVTSQGQINAFANGQLGLLTQGMVMPPIVIPGGVQPSITQLTLGDQFGFTATSPRHPAITGGGNVLPGLQATLRLTGWTCTPEGPQQAEEVQLDTSLILATP